MCCCGAIKLTNGQTIKVVDDEGYKYLGILELDKLKEKEMKDIFRTEYLRAVVCKIRAILKRRCHTISPNWLKIGM